MSTDRSWGWRARFGMLVIHKDPVPEAEIWAMAPPGVTIHTARFESPRHPGSDYTGDPAQAVAESPDIARGLDFLGQMLLDVICVTFGSASFFGGVEFDGRFASRASTLAHGLRVTTAAQAMLAALRTAGVRRPLMVIPPWFSGMVVEAAERYFTAAGFDVAGRLQFDLGPAWRGVPEWETYDRGAQWTVRTEELYRQVRRSFPAGADGVLIPGSGFRSLEAIPLLEADLDVPVIASNQACLWHCLQVAGVAAEVADSGRLFGLRLST